MRVSSLRQIPPFEPNVVQPRVKKMKDNCSQCPGKMGDPLYAGPSYNHNQRAFLESRRSRVRNLWRGEMKLRRRVAGILKDNAAISRAIAHSKFSALHVALLRATSHEESPPDEKDVNAVLSWGSSSRLRVSQCVEELMKRLNRTHNWAVALKSLILLHRALRGGAFIFQDRLALCTANGGRNLLNLSNFKDRSSPETWQLSAWVRAYAGYVDQWLATWRALGAFPDDGGVSAARSADAAVAASDERLLGELAALGELLGATCECRPPLPVAENPVVGEALSTVFADSCRLQQEILVRVEEIGERMFRLRPPDAARFLAAAEGLGRRQEIFCELMCGSLQVRLLAGPGCDDVTARLVPRLARVKQSLRAVGGLQPPVSPRGAESGIAGGRLCVSARFAGPDPGKAAHQFGVHGRLPSLI